MFSYVNIEITFRKIRNEVDCVCERRQDGGHHGVITEGKNLYQFLNIYLDAVHLALNLGSVT